MLRKFAAITCMLFLTIGAGAQLHWAPDGATWQYWSYNFGYYVQTIEVVGDSTVQGKVCKVINYTNCPLTSFDVVTYSDTNKVYILLPASASRPDSFIVLYDFSDTTPGYSWQIPVIDIDREICDTITIEIASYDSILLSGKFLKRIRAGIQMTTNHCGFLKPHDADSIEIIEALGPLTGLLPWRTGACEDLSDSLTCYSDSSILYGTCLSGIALKPDGYSLQVYPTPADDYLIVDIQAWQPPYDGIYLTVLDVLGHKVQVQRMHRSGKLTIDISPLAAGVYILSTDMGTSIQFVKR